MNSSFGVVDGKPTRRAAHAREPRPRDRPAEGRRLAHAARPEHQERRHARLRRVPRRVRGARSARPATNKLAVDDFAGTTVSITNPGTIGTDALGAAPDAGPGRDRRRRRDHATRSSTRAPTRRRSPRSASARSSRSRAPTTTASSRAPRAASSSAAMHELLLGERRLLRRTSSPASAFPTSPPRWGRDHKPLEGSVEAVEKALAVKGLINMYRVRGHLIANLDPLGLKEPRTHAELDPINWGLTIWDLDREFPTGGLAGKRVMRLRDILGVLRDAYSRTIGVEYMHIQEPDEKAWIQRQVEGVHVELDRTTRSATILASLNAAEAFERFLHTKYLGQKRFSLEGARDADPDARSSCSTKRPTPAMEEVVMGMSHRGRLNVLANVVGKSYGQIFREFEGELDPNVPQGSGDVKYHVGATGKHTAPLGQDRSSLTLAANPSHLEAVDPVVEGMVARQAGPRRRRPRTRRCCPVLHPRRRRVRGPGRRRRDAEPLGAAGLRRRRHGARRRQQPGRLHDAARLRAARPCTPPTSPRRCRRRSST